MAKETMRPIMRSRRMRRRAWKLLAGGAGAAGLNGDLLDIRFANFIQRPDRGTELGAVIAGDEDARDADVPLQVLQTRGDVSDLDGFRDAIGDPVAAVAI